MSEEKDMTVYQCQMASCGYMYMPAKGDIKGKIPAGTPFNELPDTWKCPLCGATKTAFKPLD